VSFEEAGGDSLKLLQLVLGLERPAGRRLKLDLFDPDMRMDDAVSIVGGMTSEDSDPEPRDRRPMVFLLPGLDGDEPRLAAFRAELTDEVRFSVIDYPDWPETAASGGGFDTVVASAVSTILAKQTSGPIMLAGYSYGGDVGFAAAVRLITLGRTVAFLGILDTDLYSLTAISGMFGQNRLQRRRRLVFQEMSDEGPGTGLGFLLAKFARDIVGLERVARHHHLWRWLLPLQTEFAFDRRMRRISRLREQWRRHDRATPASIDSRTRPGSGRAVTAVGEKFR
jgi:pimeloyl-ACP methyl ester carboxylesterase